MREMLLALGLCASAAAVVYGVQMIYVPAAWMLGGVAGGVLTVLFLAEASD